VEGVWAHLARRPLLGAAALMVLGIGCAQLRAAVGWVYVASALALALASAAVGRRHPGYAALAALATFFAAGYGSAALRQSWICPAFDGRPLLLEGVVEGLPRAAGRRTQFTVAVEEVLGSGGWKPARFVARLSSGPIDLLPGDRVRLRAQLFPPPPALNPGVPDFAGRARIQGLLAVGSVVEQQVALIGPPSFSQLQLERLRSDHRALAADAVGDGQAAALIRSLAIGDRADISPSVNDDFNASGLAHILSVSGLHIAVVAAGLYRALRWLLTRSERAALACDPRAIASLAAIPATWLYAVVTGGEVPAVRSALMASALFSARALGRDADAPSALALALIAVLAWDPAALQSISFQLSFGAVAGLMLLTGPLRELAPIRRPDPSVDPRWRFLLEAALSSGVASLAASLATAPLVAGAFQRASVVAVAANVVALPVASALTALSAASAVALPASRQLAGAVLCLCEPLARLLLAISRFFGELPFASLRVPAPSALFVGAWYAGLLALAGARSRPRAARRAGAAAALTLLALALRRGLAPLGRTGLTVTFLAVGQGDSALVQLPSGKAILIDAGGDPAGRYDVGERVVVPALTELGATALEAAVLSHPHPDHGGGMAAVLRQLEVRQLWLARVTEPQDLIRALRSLASARGSSIRELARGDRLDDGPVRIEVLHPGPEAPGASANDASLALRISMGEVAFLFPGDVEAEGEAALLSGGPIASQVLKAPHHGSRTSSSPSFVERVRPGHVVFCVGRNRFGFPLPEVVDRYRAAGCRLHRTDQDGAVTFWTDGRALEVEHFVPRVAVRDSNRESRGN
jgi:competence protein ComEC